MDFAKAWDELAVDDGVAVSNGKPPPSSNTEGIPYKTWRSHNFSGRIVEKIDGPPRALRIELPEKDGATVSYTVTEGVGHDFAAS